MIGVNLVIDSQSDLESIPTILSYYYILSDYRYYNLGKRMYDAYRQSYGRRALDQKNPAAKLLLETMERKKSNLAVSVDVTKSKDFLAIIDAVGPFVCLIKAIFRSSEVSSYYSHQFSKSRRISISLKISNLV